MRAIRFRLWNTVRKKMYGPYPLIKMRYDDCSDIIWLPLQYTGLHDRTGREIYEGDIIRGYRLDYYSTSSELEERAVEWDECGAWWPFANNDDEAPYPKPEECEIVGNIYENPELMAEKVDGE